MNLRLSVVEFSGTEHRACAASVRQGRENLALRLVKESG